MGVGFARRVVQLGGDWSTAALFGASICSGWGAAARGRARSGGLRSRAAVVRCCWWPRVGWAAGLGAAPARGAGGGARRPAGSARAAGTALPGCGGGGCVLPPAVWQPWWRLEVDSKPWICAIGCLWLVVNARHGLRPFRSSAPARPARLVPFLWFGASEVWWLAFSGCEVEDALSIWHRLPLLLCSQFSGEILDPDFLGSGDVDAPTSSPPWASS